MNTRVIHIGVREFREDLSRYLESPAPLAITRHGRTLGFYIPASASKDAELEAIAKAINKLQTLLAEKGIEEEDIVREFKTLRATNRIGT
jgi:hypothetical protein